MPNETINVYEFEHHDATTVVLEIAVTYPTRPSHNEVTTGGVDRAGQIFGRRNLGDLRAVIADQQTYEQTEEKER